MMVELERLELSAGVACKGLARRDLIASPEKRRGRHREMAAFV
jgi:hypothetical protein